MQINVKPSDSIFFIIMQLLDSKNVQLITRFSAGIKDKLSHFTESGITAIWLSPINRSPMRDFGYDISDFEDVDPIFGTIEDLKNLTAEAKKRNLKVTWKHNFFIDFDLYILSYEIIFHYIMPSY